MFGLEVLKINNFLQCQIKLHFDMALPDNDGGGDGRGGRGLNDRRLRRSNLASKGHSGLGHGQSGSHEPLIARADLNDPGAGGGS